MSTLSWVFILWSYLAMLVFAGGLGFKLWVYLRTPNDLPIVLTPAPLTRAGVVGRLLAELLWFKTTFRASRATWLFGWVLHAAGLLILAQHLRYITREWWTWVAWLHAYGWYVSVGLGLALLGLWARRLLVARIRYISRPADHLMLALLAGIVASGMWLKYLSPTDVVAVKAFVRGVLGFSWQPMPPHPVFCVHLTLVLILLTIFPFSKLMHAPGLFVSPTLTGRSPRRSAPIPHG